MINDKAMMDTVATNIETTTGGHVGNEKNDRKDRIIPQMSNLNP